MHEKPGTGLMTIATPPRPSLASEIQLFFGTSQSLLSLHLS